MKKITLLMVAVFLSVSVTMAKKKEEEKKSKGDTIITSSLVSALKFRSIGPAWASGRISDFAMNPENPKEYFTEKIASGDVEIKQLADEAELFGKGYLNFYGSLTEN